MKNRVSTLATTFAFAASALLFAGSTLAGPPDHDGPWRMGPPAAEQQLARLSQDLDLTPAQSQQMLELLLAAEADHEAIRARIMEEAGPEICAIRQNTHAEILAILTPEQADLFEQLMADRQNRREQRGERGRNFADCQD